MEKERYNPKKEIESINKQMDSVQKDLSSLTPDRLSLAPLTETTPQTLMSSRQVQMLDPRYIKPSRSQTPNGKPKASQNALRDKAWEYVNCMVENKEVPGETACFWLKPPISGEFCYYWEVPVNIPVQLPRFVADHLSKRYYHRMRMEDRPVTHQGFVSESSGAIIITETKNRIDCRPVSQNLNFAMGF